MYNRIRGEFMIKAYKIGENIKKQRERHGFTQAELAHRLYVSFQAISAWERGLSLPDLEKVMNMAEIFSVSVDMLLSDYNEELFIGIDGGGSKTEYCAILFDGTVKKLAYTAGTNPNDIGIEKCCETLTTGIEMLLTNGHTPQMIFAGIAGMTVGKNKEFTEKYMKNRYRCDFYTDTDAINGLCMGADPDNSAMVICGTGSCVFIRKNGIVYRMGGWGQLFDESGSAYDVGKDAIRHTLAVFDGLEKQSLVSNYIERVLDCNIWEGLGEIYKKGRPFIASLAAQVATAYNEGDEAAKSILNKNARYLGNLIKEIKKKYGINSDFIAMGGFFENNPFYREMVENYSQTSLVITDFPPVYGACVEAVRRNGRNLPENFGDNFIKSYRRISC